MIIQQSKRVRPPKKRVLVFGVFDLLHPGHRAFLKQAKRYGDELIVVVARGNLVRHMKGMEPHEREAVRLKQVQRLAIVHKAVRGDVAHGKYGPIRRFRPAVVCCGYDQEGLYRDLKARMKAGKIPKTKLVRLKPYRPKHFKSSIERQRLTE